MQYTLKPNHMCTFKVLYPCKITADFSMQNIFEARNMHQNKTLYIFTQQYTWKVLCTEKSMNGTVQMRTSNFKSVLHDNSKTWGQMQVL